MDDRMLSHVHIGITDFQRAFAFYRNAMDALGYPLKQVGRKSRRSIAPFTGRSAQCAIAFAPYLLVAYAIWKMVVAEQPLAGLKAILPMLLALDLRKLRNGPLGDHIEAVAFETHHLMAA